MVRTGKRAAVLAQSIRGSGLEPDLHCPPPPRLVELDEPLAARVRQLYLDLGGALDHPSLRPGAWDLSFGGRLIELDEELHFNRYRRLTLEVPELSSLPWSTPWRSLSVDHEPDCLRAATWGKRWSSDSSARMFGGAAAPGDLASDLGAPRWKQRALYDAMKDAAALTSGLHVARLSVYDDVAGVQLGPALEAGRTLDPRALIDLLDERTT